MSFCMQASTYTELDILHDVPVLYIGWKICIVQWNKKLNCCRETAFQLRLSF